MKSGLQYISNIAYYNNSQEIRVCFSWTNMMTSACDVWQITWPNLVYHVGGSAGRLGDNRSISAGEIYVTFAYTGVGVRRDNY